MTEHTDNRRPIAARSTAWAQALTSWLVRARVSPNAISVASVVFAAGGSAALVRWPAASWALVACAAAIALRLLCNMLDGMVAVEGGRGTPAGALYNEVPDRLADSLFLVALGHAACLPWLGWLAALAAALTAYVRTLGGALGLPQSFRGPMAKPHRMAVMLVACLVGAVEQPVLGSRWALVAAAWVIAVGSLLTTFTRARAIARALGERAT